MPIISNDPVLLVAKVADRVFGETELASLMAALPEWQVAAYANVHASATYVYVQPVSAGALPKDAWAHPLAQIRAAFVGADPAIVLLAAVQDLPGASNGRDAPWHYVVETDVVADQDAALNDWYNREHLPGLASVPGTVRARRFVCEQGGPRYHACYDLETRETFGSPPWLAVRATDWSSQVRPAFRNTKRTMFKRIVVGA